MSEDEGQIEVQGEAQVQQGDDLAVVRELILRAHPDVVPELIGGSSVAELLASVEGARAAYLAVVERVQERKGAGETPALQGKGAGETPALQRKGAGETPALQGKGAGETPALQGKGAGETPAVLALPKVPAGGGAAVVNVEDLPAAEKIKRGIANSRQPSGSR